MGEEGGGRQAESNGLEKGEAGEGGVGGGRRKEGGGGGGGGIKEFRMEYGSGERPSPVTLLIHKLNNDRRRFGLRGTLVRGSANRKFYVSGRAVVSISLH